MKIKISSGYKFLIASAVAGYPLVASLAGLFGVESFQISIIFRLLVLLISLFILLTYFANRSQSFTSRHLIALLIFWFAYLLRLSYETLNDAVTLSREPLDYWLWSIGACIFPALALSTIRKECTHLAALLPTWILTYIVVITVLFYGSGTYLSADGIETEIGRLNIKGLDPISSGHIGSSLVILSFWQLFFQWRKRIFWQIIGAVASLAGFYLVFLSGSRGPLLALLIVLLVFAAAIGKRKIVPYVFSLAIVFFILTPILSNIMDQGDYSALNRITNFTQGEDLSIATRQMSYVGALTQFFESPIFGDSIEEKLTGFYPHNVILEAFMATGLIGGVAFLFLLAFTTQTAFKILLSRSSSGWVALIYLQYLIAAQTSGAIYTVTTFWSFTGILISYASLLRSPRFTRFDRSSNLGKKDSF